MNRIRLGVIGVGNIGSAHAKALFDGKVEGAELSAVCDISPEKRAWAQEYFPGVEIYSNSEEFFANSRIDGVILAVPHYFHCPYAIKGFEAGMHVLTEKPAGVQVSEIKKVNEAALKSGKRFGIMFNQRTDPMYREIRRILQKGELGEPIRLLWETTNWYRTQEYYDSGDWRATWAGEGGGVLMNQAPHQLDLMQWIFGLPKSVRAECHIGKYHNIEVEDEATLYCTYENGATAIFHTSTGEEFGVNRLEIVGTKGRLTADGRILTKYCKDSVVSQQSYENRGTQHLGILNEFVSAIRTGTPLLAEGIEGIREAEISNAAYLSSWTGRPAAIPTDTEAFDQMLEERRKNSALRSFFSTEISDGEYKTRWQNS